MPSMLRLVAASGLVIASASAFAPSGGLPVATRANVVAASRSTVPRSGALSLQAEVEGNAILSKFSTMIKNKDLENLKQGNVE
jgi:hypothetical protein